MPVQIHGKTYFTVAERIEQFRSDHPEWTIETGIESLNDDFVVTKTVILDHEGRCIATGLAQEYQGSSMINKTSHIENCETSSCGRALSFLGYAGTEIASADEVKQAINQQPFAPINGKKEKLQEYLVEASVACKTEDGVYAKELADEIRELGEDFFTFWWRLMSSKQQEFLRKHI